MAEQKGGFFRKPFAKAFGKNKMSLKTDKAYYVSGELVTGIIKVKLEDDILCKGVMFKVTGYEKTEWDEVKTDVKTEEEEYEDDEGNTQTRTVFKTDEYLEEREGRKDFFKERLNVSDERTVLEAGLHEFPFQYQLPQDLPGVFEYENKEKRMLSIESEDRHEEETMKTKAKIVYKLKCYLDFKNAKDLTAKQELVVHELLEKELKPSSDETTQTVMLCCCIPRGECELKAVFDKNAYAPGECAQCFAKIDNRSSSDVGNMKVKLMRTITLKGKHGASTRIVDTVLEAQYEGVPSETSADRPMPLQLAPEMQPSTKGQLVKCAYHFDVECDISMAPDIELHMPMILYAPPPMVWGIPMEEEE